MKQLHIMVSDELHDKAKAEGDHGILTKICTFALEQYLMDPARDAERTPEELDRLNAWRAGHIAKNDRCRIINEVLEREIWPTFGKFLAKKGLTRSIMDSILMDLRPALYARHKIMPPDRELKVAVKEMYERKTPEMDRIRCESYKAQIEMAIAQGKGGI